MRRISKIKIFGKTIDIKYTNDKNVGRNYLGLSSSVDNLITLSENQAEENVEETFLHEILHIVSEGMNTELSEKQVIQISTGLYSVFKENKLKMEV